MKRINLFPLLAASLLLAACTSENTLEKPELPDPGTSTDPDTREVLVSLKNKLQIVNATTKADDPIASAAENRIYSLDVYVFGASEETGTYTFQERFYYREDARQTVDGDYATSFTLTPNADNSTALIRIKKGLFVKVYCIANSTTLVDPATNTEFTGYVPLLQSKPGQPDNIVIPGQPTLDEFLTFHTDPLLADDPDDVLFTPLPMTGAYTTPLDLTDFSVSARTQLGFKLTRMVARFDVTNDAAQSKFTVQSISLGNGRTGATYFPVKVLGTAPGDLITYPARDYTADQTGASPKGLGVFYCYPSPEADGGYLILNGSYAANLTEAIPVTYRVPFKPAGDETGNYIEVANNHRYTVNITNADPYHLDFTIDVADWADEESINDYKPENDFTKDAFKLAETGNTGDVKTLSDGRIVMDAAADKTLAFTIASNTADIDETLDYGGGDEWLVKDGDRITVTKASMQTTYKYKTAEGAVITSMNNCLPVTIRLVNKASGKNLNITIVPTALTSPGISLVTAGSEGCTYDVATRTVTIPNKDNQTFKLKATAVTIPDGTPETGSSVAVTNNWISADAPSKDSAEGEYVFTLGTAQDPVSNTNTLTFTSAATGATTEVTVALKTVEVP